MSKTISVELYTEERDFIVDIIGYTFFDDMRKKITNAKANKDNILTIRLTAYELEHMIGNLSLEANHNKNPSIQDIAYEMAEKLECYEYRLRA